MAEFLEPAIAESGYPAETSLETVEPGTRTEFRSLYALLQGWMSADHEADGTHKRIRAVSVATAEGVQAFGRSVQEGVSVDIAWEPAIYTINAAGSWDVTSGNQLSLKAARFGNLLWMSGDIVGSNVTAPVGDELRVRLPWNLMGLCNTPGAMEYDDAGGARSIGLVFSRADTSYLALRTQPPGPWTATAANDTLVRFSIVFPVATNPLL